MKTKPAIASFLFVSLLAASAHAALGDTTWNRPVHAAGFPLDGLPAPIVLTSPLLFGSLPVGPCVVQVDGSRNQSCATDLVVDPPLVIIGGHLQLPFDSTLHAPGGILGVVSAPPTGAAGGVLTGTFPNPGLNFSASGFSGQLSLSFLTPGTVGQVLVTGAGPAATWGTVPAASITGLAAIATSGSATDLIAGTVPCLRLSVLTGDIGTSGCAATIQPNVVTFAKIQQVPALSLVAVPGTSTANVSALTFTANNQVAQMLAGTLQAHALDFSQLTGTPPAMTSVTGAVVGSGPGATATTFGLAGAHSALVVSGGSAAVPAFVGPATAGQVLIADPSTTAVGWEIPPLVTLSTPGYMSAADKLKINGGVTPTVVTDLLRYGDLQSCVGVIQWTGSALGCAPTLGFVDPFAVVGGNLTLKFDTVTLGIVGGQLTVLSAPGTTLAAGAVGFGSPSNALAGDAANFHWDGTNLRFGLRNATPAYEADFVDETGAADRGLALRTFVTSTAGPSLRFMKYRGTFASPTTVTNTDYLGSLGFSAYDGTNPIQIGEIVGHVTSGATVTTGSIPSEIGIAMSTTGVTDPYGNNSLMALRVRSSGSIGLGMLANDAFKFSNGEVEIGAFSGTTSLSRTAIVGGSIGLYGTSGSGGVNITRSDGGSGSFLIGNNSGTLDLRGSLSHLVLGSGIGSPYALTFQATSQSQVGFSTTTPTTTNWGLFRVELNSLTELFPSDTIAMSGSVPLDSYFFRGVSYIFAGGANTNPYGFNQFTIGAPTFNSPGSSAVSMATLALLGVPSVTGISGPVYGFDVQGATTDTSIHTAGGVLINGQASTALRVSTFGAGYVKSSGSGQFSVSSTVGLGDLATCSTGQVVGMVSGVQGCVTPASGGISALTSAVTASGSGSVTATVHLDAGSTVQGLLPLTNITPSGTNSWVLTTVAGAVVWQAQAAPGVGTVTNVSMTAGDGTVASPTSTPVISLAAVGPGAGTYGGSGVASLQLDGRGRVVAVTPATYLTSTGTTPGTYNNITVASSGLVVGNSNTSWMTANQVMLSAGLSAVPVGDSHFTYDPSTHTFTSSGANVLGGSVQFPGAAGAGEVLAGISNTGFLEDVFPISGLSLASGVLTGVPFVAAGGSGAMGMVPSPGGTAGLRRVLYDNATWGATPKAVAYYTLAANPTVVSGWLVSSSATSFGTTRVDYPMSVAATAARIAVNVTRQSLSCTTTATATLYVNGGNSGCSVTFLTNTTGVFDSGFCSALGTTATSDNWGVLLTAGTTGCIGSMDLSAVMTIE